MNAWDPVDRARDLLRQCSEEVGDRGRAAVLQSEFARLLSPEDAMALLDEGQFCRAFALAAAHLALSNPAHWSAERLIQLADMCYHNGDAAEADALLDVVRLRE